MDRGSSNVFIFIFSILSLIIIHGCCRCLSIEIQKDVLVFVEDQFGNNLLDTILFSDDILYNELINNFQDRAGGYHPREIYHLGPNEWPGRLTEELVYFPAYFRLDMDTLMMVIQWEQLTNIISNDTLIATLAKEQDGDIVKLEQVWRNGELLHKHYFLDQYFFVKVIEVPE